MVKHGCSLDGQLDDSMFSQPIPWIGLYIAAASAICAIAMAADAFHGFCHRKFWFPSRFFCLNAATLTLIAVSTKLSVDLNTSMPRRQDQLAKLSSGAMMCTVMGNSMPSLGTMGNKEIMMNVVALGILVITAIVNICIQMGTGVIYIFWKEHAVIMFLMLVLLVIWTSSALIVPTTKGFFEMKYTHKHQIAMRECSEKSWNCIVKKLRMDLTKFWVMAHTCGPQFVLGRSATCTASGAFSLLAAVTLGAAITRAHLVPQSFKFCSGESDYKWSTTLILVTQVVAVTAGTIAPALRWFTAINFKNIQKADKACKFIFKVESYWIQRLRELKEFALPFKIGGRQTNKLAHDSKNLLLDFCIKGQTGIVLLSKVVRLISIFSMSRFFLCYRYVQCLKRVFKRNNSIADDELRSEPQPGPELVDLSRFVMHLEGEEELVDLLMRNNTGTAEHWFSKGKKNQPKHLIHLLEKSKSILEFKGVCEFDSYQVPSLDSREPPNCWTLPLVTLTSIASALPGIDQSLIKELNRGVNEGLLFARIVENNINSKEEFRNVRKAAETLWLKIDLYHRWLDVDLRKLGLEEKSPEKVLQRLADVAKQRFFELRNMDKIACLRDSPSSWPIKLLAANCMYRISQTILMEYKLSDYGGSERLFETLSLKIADILGACLTNLPIVIPMECQRSSIEDREDSVRHALILLGKAEKILKILEPRLVLSSDAEQLAYIDNWRSLGKEKTMLASENFGKGALGLTDVYLSVE